ncbi:MAG: transposase [Tessaracoccus sp.]
MIPGWRYLWIAALEPGTTSWTALLETRRLHPDEDETMVTANRLKTVFERLHNAGHWKMGDPDLLVVMDSGYDVTRLTWLLKDLPVTLVAEYGPTGVLRPGRETQGPTKGRGPRHGHKLTLADPESWPRPTVTTTNQTTNYGLATAIAFDHQHQRLECRGPWADHHGEALIIEGTLIQLTVDHLPGDRAPAPVWLWCSTTGATTAEVDHYWSAYLRRFDLEHTFRFLKQTLAGPARCCAIPRLPIGGPGWSWPHIPNSGSHALSLLITGCPGNPLSPRPR